MLTTNCQNVAIYGYLSTFTAHTPPNDDIEISAV